MVAEIQSTVPRSLNADSNEQAVNWESIEITFLNDEQVQFRKGTDTEILTYQEFVRSQGRYGLPNPCWQLLRFMAQEGGAISRDALRWTPKKVQQTVQAIRKLLQLHFDLAIDPLPLVNGAGYTGYRALFKIGYASS
jgi:hypothetical protein